jgi:apolipoprotein N-acyltransferase
MARMRALENGRYLLRGTNNGVSAIIDHRGQLVAQTPQFVTTTLYGEAQAMLGRTPFSSLGSTVILSGCGLALVIMLLLQLAFWRDSN